MLRIQILIETEIKTTTNPTPSPMPIFAPMLRPSRSGCGVVEMSVLALVGMDAILAGTDAMLVGKLASEPVVVDADVLVVLATLAELDTPIVAAIDTPSFSSQHVVFPPWQHQVPSPQSVSATFCVGSPFSCSTTRVSPTSNARLGSFNERIPSTWYTS